MCPVVEGHDLERHIFTSFMGTSDEKTTVFIDVVVRKHVEEWQYMCSDLWCGLLRAGLNEFKHIIVLWAEAKMFGN